MSLRLLVAIFGGIRNKGARQFACPIAIPFAQSLGRPQCLGSTVQP
jgi:hypothetical protein